MSISRFFTHTVPALLFVAIACCNPLSAQIIIENPPMFNGSRDSVETSIRQIPLNLNVFPNPGMDQIQVGDPLKTRANAPVLFDLLGNRINLSWRLEEFTWVAGTADLAPGIYLVVLETEVGYQMARWRKL